MNPILIIGRDGQVGHELRQGLASYTSVEAIDIETVDLTRPESIREVCRSRKPRLIVNAAAYTAVDQAEKESDLAFQINAEAPKTLAEEANRLQVPLFHFSTDYVFDGLQKHPYSETDSPCPQNIYGESKWRGDQAIQATADQFMIFRLCWVYGLRGRNFFLTMRRLLETQPEIRVVNDQVGSPTPARVISQTVASIIRSWDAHKETWAWNKMRGIYHLSCTGQTSWHGFAEAIAKYTTPPHPNTSPRVLPIPSSQYPTPAKRPPHSVLNCKKIQETHQISLPSWDEALREICKEYNESRHMVIPCCS